MSDRRAGTWLLAIVILASVLRLYAVTSQPLLPDERGAALSALHYMESGQFGPTMWYHPNLRNIVIYGIGSAFGYHPGSLRSMSLLFGILSVPLTGALLYLLSRDKTASLMASLLLAVEQVHISFSRQAIQETWTTFFFLLGTVLAVLYYRKERTWTLIASGIVFGLGLGSKFHALPPLAVCLGAGFWTAWKERSRSMGAVVVACLLLLPATVYVLTFLPWFGRGYDLVEWARMQAVLLSKMMTHQGNPMDQAVDTQAWQWFLRPTGYANFTLFEGRPYLTVAFSNPVVWLFVVPAFVLMVFRVWRRLGGTEERGGTVFLLVLFAAAYAPLAASPRPIWLLSSLAVLPFALMLAALAATELAGTVPWGKRALAGYLLLVVVSSIALYPMAVGRGKQFDYLENITARFRPAFEQQSGQER